MTTPNETDRVAVLAEALDDVAHTTMKALDDLAGAHLLGRDVSLALRAYASRISEARHELLALDAKTPTTPNQGGDAPEPHAVGSAPVATAPESEGSAPVPDGATVMAKQEFPVPLPGWEKHEPRAAFVAGAKWWEFTSQGASMWGSDQARAVEEALRRYPMPKEGA